MFTRVNSDWPPSLEKRNLVLIISTQSRFCLRKVENREFLIGRGLKSHQDTHHLVLTSRLQHSFQVVSQTMFERSNEGNSWLPEAASPFFGQLLTVRKALQMLKWNAFLWIFPSVTYPALFRSRTMIPISLTGDGVFKTITTQIYSFVGLIIPNSFNHSSSDETAGVSLLPCNLATLTYDFTNAELKDFFIADTTPQLE